MSQPPGREELLAVDLPDSPTVARSQVTRIELAAGAATPRHRHPCHVVGVVLSGRIRYQVEGGVEQILDAGAAFHEAADDVVEHFDNASETEVAAFVAVYLLGADDRDPIEML